jgi:hypothetical protein
MEEMEIVSLNEGVWSQCLGVLSGSLLPVVN